MSEQDYLEQIGALYATLKRERPHASDQEIFTLYREREFDLTIDFRLGADFSAERRQALNAIRQRGLQHLEQLTSALAAGRLTPDDYARSLQRLVGEVKAEWAKLLAPHEMESLCGNGLPGIPLDPNLVGRTEAG